MLNRRHLLLSSAAMGVAGLGACATTTPPPADAASAAATTHPAAAGEAARFHALMDEWMQRTLRRSPELVTGLGLDKGEWAASKGKLDEASLAQVALDEAENERRLTELRAVNRQALTGIDAVHYDTLMFLQQQSVDAQRRFEIKAGGLIYVYGLTQLSGEYQSFPDFVDNQHTIETASDAEAYLSRLNEFARILDQERETVGHDVGRGIIPPDFALDKALVQMRALRDASPETSPLVQSVVRRTREKNIAGAWDARATRILLDRIRPALDRQLALLGDMRRRATHDAGVWKIPDGDEFYAMSVSSAICRSSAGWMPLV